MKQKIKWLITGVDSKESDPNEFFGQETFISYEWPFANFPQKGDLISNSTLFQIIDSEIKEIGGIIKTIESQYPWGHTDHHVVLESILFSYEEDNVYVLIIKGTLTW